MNPGFAQRAVALAGVALLAVVAALAVNARAEDEPERPELPASVPAPRGGWYEATAAPYRFKPGVERTACGHPARASTLGVAHPVLPCQTKLFLVYEDTQVLTQVIDRGTGAVGREFELTAPLARMIGLDSVAQIRWRFARDE